MAKLGSPKRILMLSMGITLYIIMVALLMFYIEECSIDNKTPPSQSRSDSRQIREQCKLIYASFQANSGTARADFNVSFEGCAKIVRSIAAKPDTRESTCRFNIINFFPWIHCVVFSFMTIGGTISPVTIGGQALLTLSTIIGIIPIIRLLMHTGIIINDALERAILAFEVRVLNRSTRMIHNVHKKLVFFLVLILLFYNALLAWVATLSFYGTHWTFSKSASFWLQGMLTLGQKINAVDEINFYSNGGWRILCIDVAMMGNIVLFSSLVCTVGIKMHKRHCHATTTIKKSFKNQNPEVYLHIKPLF